MDRLLYGGQCVALSVGVHCGTALCAPDAAPLGPLGGWIGLLKRELSKADDIPKGRYSVSQALNPSHGVFLLMNTLFVVVRLCIS